jgi:sterol 24-C-methyltransferase
MAVNKVQLEKEDHERDASFKKAMHGKTAEEVAGFMAMMKKDKDAQKIAVDEYFKFWDGKGAGQETEKDRKVCTRVSQPPRNFQVLTTATGAC